MWPSFPASAIQQSLSPTSTSNAPSVAAVIAALAAIGTWAPNFSTSVDGLVPVSPGGTTQFLRADGTWAVPPGGGGGGGDVASVFGRTGAVVATSGDYTFAQIGSTPTTLAGYGIVDATPLVHVGAGGGAHANVVEGGAAGFMTGAQATKLAGIATNATANSSDATLLARAYHTGSQLAATIQDFDEAVYDAVAALLIDGANITLTRNDTNNTVTVSAAGGGGGATLADGDYGDIIASSSGTVLTIDAGVVTLAKMASMPTDRLLGRDTAGTGAPEQLTVSGGIEFTGSGGIQTSAYTGDVTKSAGGTATTIAAGAVTYAKLQNIASDTLIGRDTAGSGAPEAITVGGGLEFDGAQMLRTSALTGNVTKPAGSTTTTIAAGVVTLAMLANLAQDQVIGRVTASTGVPETFTVTAAARSVLDDTSLDAMLNTLGGATATGTGAVVRANTPTLVTPVLGAATGTSLSLGGGTALTTTNRTGTGNLVLNTDPTITRAVFSGITTSDSAYVTTANAMAALDIDVTKGLNTKSVAANSTLTFSGTPATANSWFALHLINTDSAPHVITIPSSYSLGRQASITSFVIPANGQVYLVWRYDGSGYKLLGDAPYLNNYSANTAPGVGDDIANGYGPGSLWLNTTSNLAYICESNAAGSAVWNLLGGGVSDADYGDITVSGGVWTIDNGVVSMAKLANIATDSLIGRDAASTGVPTAISVGGGIEFSGSDSIRTSAFTGDVTKTAGGTALTIANSAVTLAKMADLLASRFIGRVTASTGVPESMTGTQATTLLDVFTTSLKGLAPASGGGTTNFLRADGTWAAPAGGGTVTNSTNLTNNSLVIGNGTTDVDVIAGLTTDGVSKINLGVAGSSVGGVVLFNATSGSVELRPVTGALGSSVISVPAATDTMVTLAATQTLTNKTMTSPRVGTAILDTSGNELLDVTATGSAVNQLGLVNAATGNAVQVTTAGGDTNISLNVVPKGTGEFQYAGAEVQRHRVQNSQSAAYTTVLADRYRDIVHPSADTTARVFTIDSNANVPYPIGTRLVFRNQNAAGTLTIAITSDTLRLAGAGTTGSRTLAADGVAVAVKEGTTSWYIDGVGLT